MGIAAGVETTSLNTHRIRTGTTEDLELLREIERSAGMIFAEYDMLAISEDEPPDIASLSSYSQDGRLWVLVNEADHPIAYLMADLVDGCAHIEQVSVHATHAGNGFGRALIEAVTLWASERKLPAVTLTTFRDVPWNAPYYQRLGFEILSEVDHTPGLRRIRQEEKRRGLDRWPRVCMKRNVTC